MNGAVNRLLEEYFKLLGAGDGDLLGRTKRRTIRIQLATRGINMSKFGPGSDDAQEDIQKFTIALNSLKGTR